MGRAVWLMTLIAAVAFAGCGSSHPPAKTGDRSRVSPSATPSSSSTTGRAVVQVTTPTPVPTSAVSAADLAGDGRPDRISVTAGAKDKYGRKAWTLAVSFASGETSSLALGSYSDYVIPRALGAADADGETGEELFVLVDQGASTQFASIVSVVGHHLVQATIGLFVLRLAYGGSVGHEDGARCLSNVDGRPGLAVYTVSSPTSGAGGRAHWEERDYAWSGKSLEEVTTKSGTFSRVGAAPKRFTRIECGSLVIEG